MAKEQTGEAQEQKPGKKKLVVFGAAGLIVLSVAVGGVMMMGGGSESAPVEEPEPSTSETIVADAQGAPKGIGKTAPTEAAEPTQTGYVFRDPFQVNLIDDTNRRFLQLDMQIETARPEMVELIEQNVAPLRDTIIILISSKTTAELMKVEGKLKLKQEIIQRMEGILEPGAIKAISFTDFKILTI